jgi:carbon-monoxide dehydrogenase medium subunit
VVGASPRRAHAIGAPRGSLAAMKPASFAYAAPGSLDEALALLAQHGDDGKVLAGGQSLLPVLNFRLAQPAVLIDLARVPGLDGIAATGDALRTGAMVRQRRLERDATVARLAPLLAEAVPHVAHPQIRNRGTVGGSLAHADPAAELPAVAVALGARMRLQSVRGERWVEADAFFTGLFGTALASDELLTAIDWPLLPGGCGWAFEEVARRHGDYAQVGLAAWVRLDRERCCTAARLVFLSVAGRPFVADAAARALLGHAVTDPAIAAAAAAAATEMDPSGDVHASAAFKRHLAGVVTARALRRATARAIAALETSA